VFSSPDDELGSRLLISLLDVYLAMAAYFSSKVGSSKGGKSSSSSSI
jgi:hypothetical protein